MQSTCLQEGFDQLIRSEANGSDEVLAGPRVEAAVLRRGRRVLKMVWELAKWVVNLVATHFASSHGYKSPQVTDRSATSKTSKLSLCLGEAKIWGVREWKMMLLKMAELLFMSLFKSSSESATCHIRFLC